MASRWLFAPEPKSATWSLSSSIRLLCISRMLHVFCSLRRCAAKAPTLRNGEMNRFMAKYHPMAELAPRDVVARAIVHELEVEQVAKIPWCISISPI